MSIVAMNWAWSLSELKASETLLLVALADQANDEGFCWPSQDTLAFRSRCSARTVRRTVARLEELGLVQVEHRSTPTGRQSNLYRLNVGAQPDPDFSLENKQPDILSAWVDASSVEAVDNATFPHESSNRTNWPVGGANRTSVTPQPDTGDRLLHIPNHQMEPPTIPTKSLSESSAREVSSGVAGVDDSASSVEAGGAGAPAALAGELDSAAEGLLSECLPAGWLDRLDLSARRIVAKDLAAGVASGFSPALIRSRLAANALPPADRVRNFSGLVIHRVGNALAAPRELSLEERREAARAADVAFVASVLDGSCSESLGAQYNRMHRLAVDEYFQSDERFQNAYIHVMDAYDARQSVQN